MKTQRTPTTLWTHDLAKINQAEQIKNGCRPADVADEAAQEKEGDGLGSKPRQPWEPVRISAAADACPARWDQFAILSTGVWRYRGSA